VLGFCSCQKEISHEIASTEVDVYVAGFEESGLGYVAKYWKNGQAVSLTMVQLMPPHLPSSFPETMSMYVEALMEMRYTGKMEIL
jgi:hypothetical protein